eukprot:366189-Chlamydomonas_euryale.AAC.5
MSALCARAGAFIREPSSKTSLLLLEITLRTLRLVYICPEPTAGFWERYRPQYIHPKALLSHA